MDWAIYDDFFKPVGRDRFLAKSVPIWIPCNNRRSHEARDILLRFSSDEASLGNLRKTLSLGLLQGTRYFPFSSVIRRHRERPGAKQIVQVSEIPSSGHRRLDRVTPFIDILIDTQPVQFRCAFHELPRPGCAGPR